MTDLKFTTAGEYMSKKEYFEYDGVKYDVTFAESEVVRHGGPFDRGSADSYYGRGHKPHYYVGATALSDRVEQSAMTEEEIHQYSAGHEYNEQYGYKKEW